MPSRLGASRTQALSRRLFKRVPLRRPVRVIGITGMPGSGKSEAMKVARDRGYPVVRMGDLIWEEVERRGLPRNSEHVGQVANQLRDEEGRDVWSRRTVERVGRVAAGAPVVLIDGIRNLEEVETFRRELGDDFLLVAIHTDQHHRFDRMLRRARADDSLDASGLGARDQRELGWGIARTIALADEMVVNDASLDIFYQRISDLLDRVIEDGSPS